MVASPSSSFKISILKSTWWGYGLTNALLNGILYYFSNRAEGAKALSAYLINVSVTGVTLSLICSGFVLLTIFGMAKKGQIPEHGYDRGEHHLMRLFPKSAALQLPLIAVLVAAHFTLIAGGVCAVAGCAETVPALPGAAIHGTLCGLMGMANVYLMYVARLTSLKAAQAA